MHSLSMPKLSEINAAESLPGVSIYVLTSHLSVAVSTKPSLSIVGVYV